LPGLGKDIMGLYKILSFWNSNTTISPIYNNPFGFRLIILFFGPFFRRKQSLSGNTLLEAVTVTRQKLFWNGQKK
jgi:hypothetical protein